MPSWIERFNQVRAELSERGSDPWKRALERDLPANVTNISSVALLDLLDVPPTTGNARRLAQTMRSMGFHSIHPLWLPKIPSEDGQEQDNANS